eukprot:7973413-Alexandrium_andersonii.AAC.1
MVLDGTVPDTHNVYPSLEDNMLFGQLPIMHVGDGPVHNAVSGDRRPQGLRSRLARDLGKADGPWLDLLG